MMKMHLFHLQIADDIEIPIQFSDDKNCVSIYVELKINFIALNDQNTDLSIGNLPEKQSLPGNPAFAFEGYQMYFWPWLQASFRQRTFVQKALLKVDFTPLSKLTNFRKVKITQNQDCCYAEPLVENGFGDLKNPDRADSFLVVPPGQIK